MRDFLKFYEGIRDQFGFNLEIYNSSIMDWHLTVGYKTTMQKGDEKIIDLQEVDLDLIFAKAQVELKNWLLEKQGGY